MDSGASLDLCPSGTAGVREPRGDIPVLETAMGPIVSKTVIGVTIPDIGHVSCVELPCSVHALSLGQRCASRGFGFRWEPFADKPIFTDPKWKFIELDVDNFVPIYRERLEADDRGANVAKDLKDVLAPAFNGSGDASLGSPGSVDPLDATSASGDLSEIPMVPDVGSVGVGAGRDSAPSMWTRIIGEELSMDSEAVDDCRDEAPLGFAAGECDKYPGALCANCHGDVSAIGHCVTHLPKDHSCEICNFGKASKSQSRRRTVSSVTVDTEDRRSNPFGACVHMDHVVMQDGSLAAKIAKFGLVVTDEKTDFRAVFASKTKCASSIVQRLHVFEGPLQTVRRWWTDSAPEFASAARRLREIRPLAHYQSVPRRPQANGVAERANRVVIEGTRCALLQSGMSDAWWTLAAHHWAMCYNASFKDGCGLTPWRKRYGEEPNFKIYPFGAKVYFLDPAGSKDVPVTKWGSRLVAAIFVGVSTGPGMQWDRSYKAVPLYSLMGDRRPSRVKTRRVMDVMFPDEVSFPIQAMLDVHGARIDAAAPEPETNITGDNFEIEDDGGEQLDEETLDFDGKLSENRPLLMKNDMRDDASRVPVVEVGGEGGEGGADLADAGEPEVDIIAPPPLADNRSDRPGWRIDVFGGRQVETPPWSRRPPQIELEVWVMLPKSLQEGYRSTLGGVLPGETPQGVRRGAVGQVGFNTLQAERIESSCWLGMCRQGGLGRRRLGRSPTSRAEIRCRNAGRVLPRGAHFRAGVSAR